MVLDIPGNLIFSSPCPKRLVVMSLAYILRYTISFCFLYIDLRYEKFPTVRKMHPIFSKMCRCKENYILLFDLTLLFGEYGLKRLQEEFCSNIIAVISLFDLQFQSTCLIISRFVFRHLPKEICVKHDKAKTLIRR